MIPPFRIILSAFLGPFIFFMILMSGSKWTEFKWENGSFGAASVLMFSLPHCSAASPRHMFIGQNLSTLIAFACVYTIPDDYTFVRVSLAVALSTMFMKILGVSYPPGGATTYIIASSSRLDWTTSSAFFYLLFPLTVSLVILLLIGFVLNNYVTKEPYPTMWL